MDERERQELMHEAVRGAVASEANRAHPRGRPVPSPRPQRTLALLAIAAWLVVAWIWIARPAFLFEAAAAPLSPALQEAGLRYGIYLERAAVATFMADSGRLPISLSEVTDDPEPGHALEFAADGSWSIVGREGALELRLTERMAADSFLGESLTLLRQGTRRSSQ